MCWGTTHLMLAAGNGAPACVTAMLLFNADAGKRDNNGMTAYDYGRLALKQHTTHMVRRTIFWGMQMIGDVYKNMVANRMFIKWLKNIRVVNNSDAICWLEHTHTLPMSSIEWRSFTHVSSYESSSSTHTPQTSDDSGATSSMAKRRNG